VRQIDIGIIVPYLLRRVRETLRIRHGRNPRLHLTAVLLQKWSKSRIVRPIDPQDMEVRKVHLRHLLCLRDPGLAELKTDSLLDPLRNEPRFQVIERELKFPN